MLNQKRFISLITASGLFVISTLFISSNSFSGFAQPEGNGEEVEGGGNPTCTELDIDKISSSNNVVGRGIATNVLDQQLRTFWLARGSSAWIQADLAEAKIICSVDIAWFKAAGARTPYQFDIAVSLDGSTFTTVHSGQIEGRIVSPLDHLTYDFEEDVEARYVKITINTNRDNSLIGIFNLEIDGYDKRAGTTFRYSIDENLQPSVQQLPGIRGGPPREVGVIVNPDGTRDEFVVNEVAFRPQSQEELESFLTTYNGTVLDDGKPLIIPGAESPPPENITSNITSESSGWYLIRVDPQRSSLDDLSQNMEAVGLTGEAVFSSQDVARLTALIARESERNISPNFIARPQAILEHPDYGDKNLDAETWMWMTEDDDPSTPGDQGLSIGVKRAWDYLRYMKIPPPPPAGGVWIPTVVAIIDAGFDLDQNTGLPNNENRDYSFLGSNLRQADVVDRDLRAGGDYEDWHGQGAFGVALAYPRNVYGSAGTAGEIAYPMLVRIDGSFYNLAGGIRTAILNGADVISISWAGDCNWWCRTFTGRDNAVESEVGLAIAGDHIVVAAAGNDGTDISDEYHIPCRVTGVLCVGAIMLNNGQAKPYSNFGTGVHIWAPDCTLSTVSPDSADFDSDNLGPDELVTFCGTSSATPFISGIVAMMKMFNPDINVYEAIGILQTTANPSTDPKVNPGYVDAFRAVSSLRENQPPAVTIVAPGDGASISWGTFFGRADVQDPEEGGWFSDTTTIERVTFSSDQDGQLCSSTTEVSGFYNCTKSIISLGRHIITATATDIFGRQGSSQPISIEVINNPPSTNINWPPNNFQSRTDQSIQFRGFASDPDEAIPDSNLVWSSNIDGQLGTGRTISDTLSQGVHTITLRATDSHGRSGESSITVTVSSGAGVPNPQITSPRNSAQFFTGQTITFEGVAQDEEDGELTGPSLQWHSSRDGPLGTGNRISVVLSGPPTPCMPEFIGHIITLTATDSDGNSSTAQIVISVGTIC